MIVDSIVKGTKRYGERPAMVAADGWELSFRDKTDRGEEELLIQVRSRSRDDSRRAVAPLQPDLAGTRVHEAFGGADGRTLFIAGCDSVYTIQVKVRGIVPAHNVSK